MSEDDVFNKAKKIIVSCMTDEQLRNVSKFVNHIKSMYPDINHQALDQEIRNKDLDLHKKL
jgi:hypothetical protein